jgi:hypothetical protein
MDASPFGISPSWYKNCNSIGACTRDDYFTLEPNLVRMWVDVCYEFTGMARKPGDNGSTSNAGVPLAGMPCKIVAVSALAATIVSTALLL